jgi:hypothetical protein
MRLAVAWNGPVGRNIAVGRRAPRSCLSLADRAFTEQRGDRRQRDALINAVCQQAQIPLLRFKPNYSSEQVRDTLYKAIGALGPELLNGFSASSPGTPLSNGHIIRFPHLYASTPKPFPGSAFRSGRRGRRSFFAPRKHNSGISYDLTINYHFSTARRLSQCTHNHSY